MITEEMSASEIKDRIETELSYRGKDNIYEVVLTGSIDSEIEIDFDDIKEDYPQALTFAMEALSYARER